MQNHRKIRNTFRYLLGNINDNFETINFDKLDINELPELEQLMLHKIYVLNDNLKYFNNYDFHNLYREYTSCTVDLSAFILISEKIIFIVTVKIQKKINNYTSKYCIKYSIKWFAPILSFTSEEIFKLLFKDQKSIHLEKFLEFPVNLKMKTQPKMG